MSDHPLKATETATVKSVDPEPRPLLSDDQIRWVKRAIIIMTTMLAIGIPLLIGRIIYLARNDAPAPPTALDRPNQALLPQHSLSLPAGAIIRSVSQYGPNLILHHVEPGGTEAVTILDLVTGRIASRIDIRRGP